jgi:hypothetical protein
MKLQVGHKMHVPHACDLLLTSVSLMNCPSTDYSSCRSLPLATHNSSYLFCYQSRVRIQSTSSVCSLYRQYGIQFLVWRSRSFLEYIRMGDSWFDVGTRFAMVFPFPTIGDCIFLSVSINHEATPHGMGRFRTSVSLRSHFPCPQLFGSVIGALGSKWH